jgi:hypothetical protein
MHTYLDYSIANLLIAIIFWTQAIGEIGSYTLELPNYTKYLLQAPQTCYSTLCLCNTKTSLNFFDLHQVSSTSTKNMLFNIVSLQHQNLLELLWVIPSIFYKHQKHVIQHCVFATPKPSWTSLNYTTRWILELENLTNLQQSWASLAVI